MFSAGKLMVTAMGSVQDHYAVQQLSPEVRSLVVTHDGLDERKVAAVTNPQVKNEIEAAKQYSAGMTYKWVAMIPAVLTLMFSFLFLYFKAQGGYRAISISRESLQPKPLLR